MFDLIARYPHIIQRKITPSGQPSLIIATSGVNIIPVTITVDEYPLTPICIPPF